MSQLNTEAVASIAKLAEAGIVRHQALAIADQQRPCLIWPDKSLTPLEHLLPRPTNKRGSAALGDAIAFAIYVNAHRTPGLIIYGEVNETGGYFVAILDGHVPNRLKPREGDIAAPVEIEAEGAPAWGEHRARLDLVATPEWARWIGRSGKNLAQEEFAVFLEENAVDVITPPPEVTTVAGYPVPANLPNAAQLTSVALTLQTKADVQFSSRIVRQSGQTQVSYVEKIDASHGAEGTVGIPEFFALAIAPFRGCAPQIVLARLRFRAAGGKANFTYEIIRAHKIVEHAWRLISADIAAATGEDVLLGSVSIPGRNG